MKLIITALALVLVLGTNGAMGENCDLSAISDCLGDFSLDEDCKMLPNITTIKACIDKIKGTGCTVDSNAKTIVDTIDNRATKKAEAELKCKPECGGEVKVNDKDLKVVTCGTEFANAIGSDNAKNCVAAAKLKTCLTTNDGTCAYLKTKHAKLYTDLAAKTPAKCGVCQSAVVSTILLVAAVFFAKNLI